MNGLYIAMIGLTTRNTMIVSLYQVGELPRKFSRRASAIV